MSETAEAPAVGETPAPANDQEPKKVQLVITLSPTGRFEGVEGPLDQEILCLGLLECAKDAVRVFCRNLERAAREKAIIGAKGIPPGLKIPGVHFGRRT